MKIKTHVFLAVALVAAAFATTGRAATLLITWENDNSAEVKSRQSASRVYELGADGKTWSLVKELSAVNGAVPLAATVENVTPGPHTYGVTFVDFWGESEKATASTPPASTAPGNPIIKIAVQVSVTVTPESGAVVAK
jgi:hypothetical protein